MTPTLPKDNSHAKFAIRVEYDETGLDFATRCALLPEAEAVLGVFEREEFVTVLIGKASLLDTEGKVLSPVPVVRRLVE